MNLLFSFGMPGTTELIIIAAIMLLLFGTRLPSVMRSVGKSLTEFKRGMNEPDEATSQVTDSSEPEPKSDSEKDSTDH
jgi:sec-independent protein translocase protein TatA